MVDGVDDWVVDGGCLGQQGGQHGDDGRDVVLVEEQTLPQTKRTVLVNLINEYSLAFFHSVHARRMAQHRQAHRHAEDGKTNLHNNGCVGSPADEPQSHVRHGNLGDANLGGLCVGLSVGPEVGDVHLLGLLPHSLLVSNNSLHDEKVREHDDEERDAIIEDEDADAERPKVPVSGEVIEGARVQDACNKSLRQNSLLVSVSEAMCMQGSACDLDTSLRNIHPIQIAMIQYSLTLRNELSPAKEGRKGPADGVSPGEEHEKERPAGGHGGAAHAVHDHVVAIV